MNEAGDNVLSPFEMVLHEMNSYRKIPKTYDIKIVGDGVECYAHKGVLAPFSKYFKAMFLGGFSESNKSEIELPPEIPSCVIEEILEYAYTYKIKLTNNNVEILFITANFLQADKLMECCCRFLEQNLCFKNCLHIADLANQHNCTKLMEKTKDFFLKNFYAMVENNTFLELTPETLMNLISNENLNIESDELIIGAINRWTDHRPEERSATSSKLLAKFRVADVNPVIPVILVFATYTDTIEETILCYSFGGKFIKELRGLPVLHRSTGRYATVSGDMKMVLSGNDDVIFRLDLELEEWVKLPPMNVPRHGYVLTELNGYWYVFGGETHSGWGAERYKYRRGLPKTNICEVVERYDPVSDSWTSISNLPQLVTSSYAVSRQGKIYVIGGLTEDDVNGHFLQCYDPQLNVWTQLPPSPVPLNFLYCGQGAFAIDDRIYCTTSEDCACGGFYFYDVVTKEWKNFEEYPRVSCSDQPFIFNDKMYLMGATLTLCSRFTYDIREFSFSSNSWKVLETLPLSLGGCMGACGPFLIDRPKQLEE